LATKNVPASASCSERRLRSFLKSPLDQEHPASCKGAKFTKPHIMRFFKFEQLVGPGKSLAENFEILNLELVKADIPDSEVFRLSAPDGGIDIYSRPPNVKGKAKLALQIKAYSIFRPDLLRAIEQSCVAAKKASNEYPIDVYIVVIAFVPTASQRTGIEAVIKQHHKNFKLCDADEIEACLFRHPGIAKRFFPNVVIASPFEKSGIVLGFQNLPEMLELQLVMKTWGQTIPIKVSLDAQIASLVNLLIGQLDLPVKGGIHSIKTVEYAIDWTLVCLIESDSIREVDQAKTFRDEGLLANAKVSLRARVRPTSEIDFIAYDNFAGAPEMRKRRLILESFFNSNESDVTGDDRSYVEIFGFHVSEAIRRSKTESSPI